MTGALQTIAQLSSARIVDCLLDGTIVALFAGLVSRLFHRQSSGTRFAVWFTALMTIAGLPLVRSMGWPAGAGLQSGIGRPAITLPSFWAFYLFGAWAAVATWFLLRVGVGLWHVHTLRKSCVPIAPAELDARIRLTLQQSGSSRPAVLCTSERVQVPTAIGLMEPLVVVPRWVIDELSPDELNQILLHELAHLRRWDDWTNLAQQAVKALFFFHPAVWWIEKKVSLEREMACDDAVLAETERPRAYAECLTHLAERTLVRRTLALAQAALGRVRQTSLRVAQILDVSRSRKAQQTWKPAIPLVVGSAVICAVFASREPHWIGFQDVHADADKSVVASTGAPIRSTLAEITTAAAPGGNSASTAQSHRAVRAKSKPRNGAAPSRHFETMESALLAPSPMVDRNRTGPSAVEPGWIHPASATTSDMTSVISTEAVFYFVPDREAGASVQPVYEIHVWRLTVWHPPVRSAGKEIPRKET